VASAEGIGFAVPINVAIPIINKFATTGEFIEPYLGVFAYDKDIIPYLDGNVKVQNGFMWQMWTKTDRLTRVEYGWAAS